MTGPRRLLLIGLLTLLAILVVKAQLGTIWAMPRAGVDLEAPLRAADRWLAGGAPYNAEGFTAGPGAVQPFLYPPYTLPLFAVLSVLPRQAILYAGVLLGLGVSLATCRRLRIPWPWVPAVLLWPPFTEGILAANVGIPIFGAFIFVVYRSGGAPWIPTPRDVAAPSTSTPKIGALATFIGAIKVSQPHSWIFVLHHRRRAAILGAVVLAAIAASTLVFTGIDVWFEWIAQLKRGSDTTWDLGGFALPRFLPPGVGYAVAAACLVAAAFVPRRNPGPWLGLLSVVGTVSLHSFGLLFLVPAMLIVRREVAIIAAAFVATYSYEGAWAATVIVAGALSVAAFAPDRWRPMAAEAFRATRNPET
jgi:hypothetical protein